MPCTAKKFELTRDDEAGAGVPDVDYAITVRELGRMLERADVPFMAMADEAYDSPLGTGTGAGAIFGVTGGVMEAALRTAADWMTGESLEKLAYTEVRGVSGVKEAVTTIAGKELRVAAVSGLSNARALLEKLRAGEAHYDFVEIMACPGGCVNGGGQPQQVSEKHMVTDLRAQRAEALYALDERAALRKALYVCLLREPAGGYQRPYHRAQPVGGGLHRYVRRLPRQLGSWRRRGLCRSYRAAGRQGHRACGA